MKRDFDVVIKHFDERPMKHAKAAGDVRIVPDGESEETRDLTMALAVSDALLFAADSPSATSAKESYRRYVLARKVIKGGVRELSNEDLTLVIKAVESAYMPLILGQIIDWCNADYVAEPKPE